MARVLAIHAHPDDVEILAGGTLALLAGQRHELTIATLTPGDCGSRELNSEEIAAVRRQEAAHAAALVPIQYTANPSLFDRTPDLTTSNLISGSPRQFLYETSGEVWFLNTNLSIHVPYYANVRSGSAFQTGLTNLTLAIGSNALTASIPVAGFSMHPQPLVSAFNLGLVSTNQFLPVPESSTDLLAIGAASDALQQSPGQRAHHDNRIKTSAASLGSLWPA